jgi:hypothetical protein
MFGVGAAAGAVGSGDVSLAAFFAFRVSTAAATVSAAEPAVGEAGDAGLAGGAPGAAWAPVVGCLTPVATGVGSATADAATGFVSPDPAVGAGFAAAVSAAGDGCGALAAAAGGASAAPASVCAVGGGVGAAGVAGPIVREQPATRRNQTHDSATAAIGPRPEESDLAMACCSIERRKRVP